MNMFDKISPASGSTQGVEPYFPINISVFSPKQPICSPSLYTKEGEGKLKLISNLRGPS